MRGRDHNLHGGLFNCARKKNACQPAWIESLWCAIAGRRVEPVSLPVLAAEILAKLTVARQPVKENVD